jgi:hypothetical protein
MSGQREEGMTRTSLKIKMLLVAFLGVVLVTGGGVRSAKVVAAPDASIPSDVQAKLRSAFRLEVSDATTQPPIAASGAVTTALSNFAWAGGGPPLPYLVRFTDPTFGPVATDQGPVAPLYVDRLAWLVVIHDAAQPILGPRSGGQPRTYRATLAVFVDANTGDYLEAVALPE